MLEQSRRGEAQDLFEAAYASRQYHDFKLKEWSRDINELPHLVREIATIVTSPYALMHLVGRLASNIEVAALRDEIVLYDRAAGDQYDYSRIDRVRGRSYTKLT